MLKLKLFEQKFNLFAQRSGFVNQHVNVDIIKHLNIFLIINLQIIGGLMRVNFLIPIIII